ncbi:pseudouridylate synthase 1 homolog [Sycon ciliatum]|uniref:pseudouridylate synthase 1 homolog n=1 Tax=Sycon ciliatum TaxID=27933 RepID=UPI0031F646A4
MEPEAKRAKLADDDSSPVCVAAAALPSGECSTAASDVDTRHSIAASSSPPSDLTCSTGAATTTTAEDAPAAVAAASTECADNAAEAAPKSEKVQRRKVALLLSYCGAHYMGMQRNAPYTTIESELFKGLLAAGCIDPEDVEDTGRMRFQRASRTDKGVSAVHQVVSFKCRMVENAIEKVNGYLPKDIKTFAIVRVTSGFSSYTQSTGRAYEYVMPTFALAPSLSKSVSSYRVDADRIVLVNRLLEIYIGTHNFHNFTSGRQFKDQSCRRVMRSFGVKEVPFVEGNMEFIILRVVGQSFMLHQIRKMIGLVLAVMKGCCDESCIQESWKEARMDIPKAPGLGLLLDVVQFHGYDRRYGNDGIHKPLVWTEYQTEIQEFKREHIISTIVEEEQKTNGMMKWLHTLPKHEYNKFTGHKVGPREEQAAAAAAAAATDTTDVPAPVADETPAVVEEAAGTSSPTAADEN